MRSAVVDTPSRRRRRCAPPAKRRARHEQISVEPLQRVEGFERILEDRLHLVHEGHARRAGPDRGKIDAVEQRSRRLSGFSMFRIIRESVVLPLPDSPMIAKISGRRASSRKLTSSTATNTLPRKQAAADEGLCSTCETSSSSRSCLRRPSPQSRRRDAPAILQHGGDLRDCTPPSPADSADGSGNRAGGSARFGGSALSPLRGASRRCGAGWQ